MGVCKHKPNENFQKRKEGRNFYLKTERFRLQIFHEDELSYALEAHFQNQGRKSIFVKT
jgi:hypothetical protein